MDQIVDSLATIPLLARLTQEQHQRLTRTCECIFVAPGKALVAQGEIADAAFLCLDDMVLSECLADGADEPEVTSVKAGSVVLELAMIVEIEATARFVAEGHARVIKISRNKMEQLLESDPALAQAISDALSERLSDTARTMREAIAAFDDPASAENDADEVSTDGGSTQERRSA